MKRIGAVLLGLFVLEFRHPQTNSALWQRGSNRTMATRDCHYYYRFLGRVIEFSEVGGLPTALQSYFGIRLPPLTRVYVCPFNREFPASVEH
jgi:hypothetical protein